MLLRGSAEDKNHNRILHFLNSFHKRCFSLSCIGLQVSFDYNFCLYRHYAFGEHSSFQQFPCYICFVFL